MQGLPSGNSETQACPSPSGQEVIGLYRFHHLNGFSSRIGLPDMGCQRDWLTWLFCCPKDIYIYIYFTPLHPEHPNDFVIRPINLVFWLYLTQWVDNTSRDVISSFDPMAIASATSSSSSRKSSTFLTDAQDSSSGLCRSWISVALTLGAKDSLDLAMGTGLAKRYGT